jgi:hypothetical protein
MLALTIATCFADGWATCGGGGGGGTGGMGGGSMGPGSWHARAGLQRAVARAYAGVGACDRGTGVVLVPLLGAGSAEIPVSVPPGFSHFMPVSALRWRSLTRYSSWAKADSGRNAASRGAGHSRRNHRRQSRK